MYLFSALLFAPMMHHFVGTPPQMALFAVLVMLFFAASRYYYN